MIATLPMYTTALTRAACDQFWSDWSQRLRAVGMDVPDDLTVSNEGSAEWESPDLIMSQTCGYPYASRLRGKVRLIATPHYDVEGCDGPNYVSWIVVHAESKAERLADLRGTRAAYNGLGSQSGYNCFRAIVAPYAIQGKFFSDVIASGGHANSMQMVAHGEADCATVDAVSWLLTLEEHPEIARRLKRIGRTPSVPGLPFITSANRTDDEVATLRQTLEQTVTDPNLAAACRTMHLAGTSVVPDADYEACLVMERTAVEAGYPILA